MHGYSYCRRRIGNCTQAFEWHQFQWCWVTSKSDFKSYYSASNNSQMVQLQWRTTESHTWSVEPRHFQWSWTTPNPDFKVRPFLMLNISKMAADTAIVTMTLLTLTYLRNDLKLFYLIVRTVYDLLLYGAPGRFVERRLTNLSLYLYFVSVWKVNRKPCPSFRMVPVWMILSDL